MDYIFLNERLNNILSKVKSVKLKNILNDIIKQPDYETNAKVILEKIFEPVVISAIKDKDVILADKDTINTAFKENVISRRDSTSDSLLDIFIDLNHSLSAFVKYVETISGNISINTDNVNEFFNIIFDKKDIFSESVYIKNGKTSKVDLSNIREIDKNLYINSIFIKEITGLPEIINGDLSLSMCSITSLPVMPDRITNLYLDGTKINNTDNICAKSVDNLYIRNIRNLNITELPQQINGNIYISEVLNYLMKV